MTPSGPDEGGFVVVPGSHRSTWFTDVPMARDEAIDFYVFSAAEKAMPEFPRAEKVCCGAGDLILWDSRTWHCNNVPTEGLRAAVYVCMLPRSRFGPKSAAKRAKALETQRCSGHNPVVMKLFQRRPMHCDEAVIERAEAINARVVLTPRQLELAR